MSTKLSGYIKSFGNAGFIAGVKELKGMVEQGSSPLGALEKLVLAVKIRTAVVEKIDISQISVIVEPEIKNESEKQKKSFQEKEVSLLLQS